MLNRRSIAGVLALAAWLGVTLDAGAQAWPAKPVKIVVPYPPGGAVDAVSRKIAQHLTQQTGQSFFVENKAGATGTIGASQVAQSAADGYTLVANDTTYALLPHIFKKLPFDWAHDLQPVGAFMFAPMTVAVKTGSPYKTINELVAAAKANPGKVSYGSGGPGSAPHFTSEALGVASGVKFMHVPFKGAGEATAAVLGGVVEFQVASTPGVMGQVKSGSMQLLAVSGDKRLNALPQVPTFHESGIKGFGVINFTGLWAPKNVPTEVMNRLQRELATAMASADMRAYADGIGAEAGFWDSATFAKKLHESTTLWGKVAADTGFDKQ